MPTLILGNAADVEVPLRAIESGAVRKLWPVGILSPARSDQGAAIRGVPVLGGFDDFERIVADATRGRNADHAAGVDAVGVRGRSRIRADAGPPLGLAASRLPSLDEGPEALRLAPVAVEDLLLRPSVKIDYRRLEEFAKGKSVIVTGGGGSIGAEICDRLVTFGAARLLWSRTQNTHSIPCSSTEH